MKGDFKGKVGEDGETPKIASLYDYFWRGEKVKKIQKPRPSRRDKAGLDSDAGIQIGPSSTGMTKDFGLPAIGSMNTYVLIFESMTDGRNYVDCIFNQNQVDDHLRSTQLCATVLPDPYDPGPLDTLHIIWMKA